MPGKISIVKHLFLKSGKTKIENLILLIFFCIQKFLFYFSHIIYASKEQILSFHKKVPFLAHTSTQCSSPLKWLGSPISQSSNWKSAPVDNQKNVPLTAKSFPDVQKCRSVSSKKKKKLNLCQKKILR